MLELAPEKFRKARLDCHDENCHETSISFHGFRVINEKKLVDATVRFTSMNPRLF